MDLADSQEPGGDDGQNSEMSLDESQDSEGMLNSEECESGGGSGVSADLPGPCVETESDMDLSEASEAAATPATDPLPCFGTCSGSLNRICARRKPVFGQRANLDIRLAQVPGAPGLATRRHSKCVPVGEEPTVRAYGSIRCAAVTHWAAPILTRRNQRELPSCLRFDPAFSAAVSPADWQLLRVVSVKFAEWLMGLPQGWTSPGPADAAVVQAALGRMMPQFSGLQASQQRAPYWKSLSIFSGCGALDFGLLPWVAPLAYCDCDEDCLRVLRARMEDGSLPRGPLFTDVREVTAKALAKCAERPNSVVASFPCQDISQAGKRQGLQGSRSILFYEIFRILDECPCIKLAFLENVNNIRFMPEVWSAVLGGFLARGFDLQWVTLAADVCGCPLVRRRWFLLARRGMDCDMPFANALPLTDGLPELSNFSSSAAGASFNFGRPPPSQWMAPAAEYPYTSSRLRMLGNAVVPQQASLAAQLLSTRW